MDAFIGEIRPFCFTFPPAGWMQCNGQELPVSQYQLLYSIIGNTFGGTVGKSFNLPNIQGMALVSAGELPGGEIYQWATTGGETTETITDTEMAAHTHAFNGGIGANLVENITKETPTPGAAGTSYVSNLVGTNGAINFSGRAYSDAPVNTHMSTDILSVAGGGQPHNNMAPYIAINYCICVYDGEYPPRN